jgi:anti-sigma B factor antagonist
MTIPLAVSTRPTAAGAVLAVSGDLDHDSADRFRTAVDTVALRPGQLLTVDLSGMAFCDSSGITALIAARHRILGQGADIALSAVPAATARVMRMLGLDRVFALRQADGTGPSAPSGPAGGAGPGGPSGGSGPSGGTTNH